MHTNENPSLRHVLGKVTPYLKKYSLHYLFGFTALALTNYFMMKIPGFIKDAIDALAITKNFDLARTSAILIIIFACFYCVTRVLSRILIFQPGRRLEYELRNDLTEHLLRQSSYFYQNKTIGDLMSLSTNDIRMVRALIGFGALTVTDSILIGGFALFYMIKIHPILTLISLVPFPIILFSIQRLIKKSFMQSLVVQNGLAELTGVVQEQFSGINILKSYCREKIQSNRFKGINEDYFKSNVELAKTRSIFIPMFEITSGIGTVIVVCIGSLFVLKGELTIGSFVAFSSYIVLLSQPASSLGWLLSIIQRGSASWSRIESILNVTPEIKDITTQNLTAENFSGELRIKNLTYKHHDGRRAIENISLTIDAGTSIGIIGPTGSGKSILTTLIPRLIDPPPNTIFIDGYEIREIPLKTLRDIIAFVPQEAFLFSRSILDNIAFGLPFSIDPIQKLALTQRAAKEAGLHQDIMSFPDGYQTMVGEKGLTLSGGQRARLALARALIADKQILILDDSMANVDSETEYLIQSSLDKVIKNRTTIIISHRIATVQSCKKIIVIEDGHITEEGTHKILIAGSGYYSRTAGLQQLQKELSIL